MQRMVINDPIIMTYMLVVAALLGLVMGSFINCWAWRYMNGESVMEGRSHCTSCGHALGVRDLIPVVSWLASGGKCRYCGEKVSARYPATEIVCAVVFVLIAAVYGPTIETIELLAFAGILLFLSLTDLDDYLIPNGAIIAALAVRIVYLAVAFALGTVDLAQIGYYVASAFIVGIVLLVVVLVADKVFGRDSMGGGDLKLYFVAGLYFGWQQCLFLVIISCIIGILVALLVPRGGSQAPAAAQSSELGQSAQAMQSGDAASANEASASGTTANIAPADGQAADAESTDAEPADVASADGPTAAAEPADSSAFKRMIPFGPSIAVSCVITMLVGSRLISWYLSFL